MEILILVENCKSYGHFHLFLCRKFRAKYVVSSVLLDILQNIMHNISHRDEDLDIINEDLDRASRFQRCDRCNMFCRGLRGLGNHRPICGRVVDRSSLVGTGDDLISILSDFRTASGGD